MVAVSWRCLIIRYVQSLLVEPLLRPRALGNSRLPDHAGHRDRRQQDDRRSHDHAGPVAAREFLRDVDQRRRRRRNGPLLEMRRRSSVDGRPSEAPGRRS